MNIEKVAQLLINQVIDILLIIVLCILSLLKKILYDPIVFFIAIITDTYIDNENLHKFYDGKVVLVTGGSSGIGESLAKKLALTSKLTGLIISGRNLKKLNEVIDYCKVINPNSKYIAWEVDLEKYQSMEESYMKLSKDLSLIGPIDVLINNAGISSRGGFLDASFESIHKVMDTNFYGTILLTRLIVKDLIQAGKSGALAVISSIQGKIALPYRTSYSSSKHAIQAYFDSIRGELKPYQISSTIISPGYVNTSLSLHAINADGSLYGKMDENTAKGMSSDYVALEILKAVANKEIEVIIGDVKSKAAIFAKNLLPELLAKSIENRK